MMGNKKKTLAVGVIGFLFLGLLIFLSVALWILFIKGIDCPQNTKLKTYRDGVLLMRSEHCEDSAGRFHGPLIEWNGYCKKRRIANFNHGEKDGMEMIFDNEGRKSMEIEYKNGLKHGRERRWWKNGQLMVEMKYKNGVLVDSSPSTTKGMRLACWGEDGSIIECPW